MKLLTILLMTISAIAGVGDSAGGSSKSWNDLYKLKDIKYYFDLPTYKFDDGVRYPAHRICLEGNTVRSIEKYQQHSLVISNGRGDQMEWVKGELDFSRRPIEVPTDDNSRNDVKLEEVVKVYRVQKFGSNRNGFTFRRGKELFSKKLEIKNCEEYDE
ncbi:hypothetical protein [Bacteriovorax sp. Seq25_V]|uniref:hypothetical protein n=1 Tax=Bacteriovorax sp. Seq25_V TaxID=1201288 RepID=UPI00038A34A5|nr:hypothetical protein [Bacteriovorax sp. Seq25_V]EQC47230.1 hypothetical protein M900_0796 [Bacteriovorax sp. Seq25_V]